mgnify:CR=1 FL=1
MTPSIKHNESDYINCLRYFFKQKKIIVYSQLFCLLCLAIFHSVTTEKQLSKATFFIESHSHNYYSSEEDISAEYVYQVLVSEQLKYNVSKDLYESNTIATDASNKTQAIHEISERYLNKDAFKISFKEGLFSIYIIQHSRALSDSILKGIFKHFLLLSEKQGISANKHLTNSLTNYSVTRRPYHTKPSITLVFSLYMGLLLAASISIVKYLKK